MSKTKIKLLFLMVLLIVCAGIGLHVYRYLKRPQAPSSAPTVVQVARVAEQHNQGIPAIGGPFQLMNPLGKTITHQSFPGKYLLIYFGYSFCPDICPAALVNISDMLKGLGHKANKLQVLFITLDPERDTPSALKTYIQNFDKRILPLTGTSDQIAQAAHAYRVFSRKMHPQNSTEYVIDHSSIIYLMNPQGKMVRHFNHQTPVQTLLHETQSAFSEP